MCAVLLQLHNRNADTTISFLKIYDIGHTLHGGDTNNCADC